MSRTRRKLKDCFYSEDEEEESGSPLGKRPRRKREGRNDNSLGVLTRKFVSLIQCAANKCIDLNEVAQILHVQKRRIYDITNVLEGIGLIQKQNKNKIKWVGSSGSSQSPDLCESEKITQELEELAEEENSIEKWTELVQNKLDALTKDQSYIDYAYITYDDIKQLPNLTDCENETLLAIRAPIGANLEVPDPKSFPSEEREKYQIYLHSETGEIMVYIVSNEPQEERAAPLFGAPRESERLTEIFPS